MLSRAWRVFFIGFGIFVAATFVYEMIGLFGSLSRAESGMETGAVLSVIFMIVVTLGVVAVIGGGLWRAIRRAAPRSPTDTRESAPAADPTRLADDTSAGQRDTQAAD